MYIIIEHINQFDPELKLGYGIDLLCGFACEDMKWKSGVHDGLLMNHLGQESWRMQDKLEEYANTAGRQHIHYFRKIGMRLRRKKYMKYADNYEV